MSEPFRVLSLGWGTQSFTLAAMAALGEIERPDLAIHADTTHERAATYRLASEWGPWLEAHGLPVVTVRAEETAAVAPWSHSLGVEIPAYTLTQAGEGQIRRQCTNRWKVQPLRQRIAEELAARGIAKRPGAAELWIGISTDEAARMKDSGLRWLRHRWPLAMEWGMSRRDCVSWLQGHGLPSPPKSSCTFCPFHDSSAWLRMREEEGEDWREAVAVDEAIRRLKEPGLLYLHPARKPLTEVEFAVGQSRLWDLECSGLCGV